MAAGGAGIRTDPHTATRVRARTRAETVGHEPGATGLPIAGGRRGQALPGAPDAQGVAAAAWFYRPPEGISAVVDGLVPEINAERQWSRRQPEAPSGRGAEDVENTVAEWNFGGSSHGR